MPITLCEEEIDLYTRAAKLWNMRFLEDLLIGEMAELTSAILNKRRNREHHDENVEEEITDVLIVMEDMILRLNDDSKLNRWRVFKLDMLKNRVETAEAGKKMTDNQ